MTMLDAYGEEYFESGVDNLIKVRKSQIDPFTDLEEAKETIFAIRFETEEGIAVSKDSRIEDLEYLEDYIDALYAAAYGKEDK